MLETKPMCSIVVSGLDDARGVGGVFAVEGGSVRAVDDIPTAGLAFDERTGGWTRAVHAVFSPAVDGAVLRYDRSGTVLLLRLSIARDLHGVNMLDDEALVVASHENAVFGVRPLGDLVKRWQLPGEPDAWHLNDLAVHEGEVFASGFCDGRTHRGWLSCHIGAGIVFSLTTPRVVAGGLNMPHSPLFIDGALLVCNSGEGELVAIDPSEPMRRLRAVKLGGFTRGLAALGPYLFIGVSARRGTSQRAGSLAGVLVLDRTSWHVVERIEVPMPEIYDVRAVPHDAVAVLDRGADQARRLIASSEAGGRGAGAVPGYPTPRRPASGSCATLEPRDARVEARARPPLRVSAGSLFELSATLTNRSERLYPVGVGGDHPVHLSYRWTSPSGERIAPDHQPLRTLLPKDFQPGADLAAVVLVRAPAVAGIYRLRITLVQEQVFWFDEANPSMAASGSLIVVLPSASGRSARKRAAVSLCRRTSRLSRTPLVRRRLRD